MAMPPSPQALQKMNIPDLKDLLKFKGLPVGSNKADSAKKTLKVELLNPTSVIHDMSAEGIWAWKREFNQYPLCPKYLANLKKQVKIEKECVKDDRNAALFHVHFPRSELNKLGYPHWDNHPAQNLLKLDVENKRHEQKISSNLPPLISDDVDISAGHIRDLGGSIG
ncbi:hypothetical protein ACHAWO_013360 [Cyclotella atomus]|uniref:SAP domain-containing protein n=1 Tax=Cyclotella atomus TaxID=382360 RepID=A0ABD3N6X8_9STRA